MWHEAREETETEVKDEREWRDKEGDIVEMSGKFALQMRKRRTFTLLTDYLKIMYPAANP
jgi:hypothetical protein